MHRIRVAAVGAIVAVALTGIAQAAPASAHEYLIEGKPVTESTKITTTIGSSLELKGTPYGIKTRLWCYPAGTETKGTLEAGGRSTLEVTHPYCIAYAPAHCTSSALSISTHGQLEGKVEWASAENTVTIGGPESWGQFTLEGTSCSLKGKPVKIGGTEICLFPNLSHERAEQEPLSCDAQGSANLEMGGKPALLETEFSFWVIVNGLGERTHQVWGAI